MTMQAGPTGPPLTPEPRVRVWTDCAEPIAPADVLARFAASGGPISTATVIPCAVPAELIDPTLPPRQVFEISGLPPDENVRIECGADACTVRTLPAAEGELRLMLGSCFHLDNDRGRLNQAYQLLSAAYRPHVRIHCGDQVYLDAGRLPDGPTPLARTLARYREYWYSEYGVYMSSGMNLFAPDDHDYWNDFPFRMPHLDRSWDGSWKAHAEAARLAYRAYQSLGNPDARNWFVLELGPVSLFLMDTRTNRGTVDRNPPPRLFDSDQKSALTEWSRNLTRPGVLVSPMPLFQHPEGKVLFFAADHNLLFYEEDARAIWSAVESAPHDIVVLAGDIHMGRLIEWRTNDRSFHEVVSSPTSLLAWPTRGKPSGQRDHPKAPPKGIQLGGAMGSRSPSRIYYGTTTDHFTMLSFQALGSGAVRVRTTVHQSQDAQTPPSGYADGVPCKAEFLLTRRMS